MTITEFVKKKIQERQEMEKRIITSMQNKDFASAVYLDNQLKNMLKADKNIDSNFKRFF